MVVNISLTFYCIKPQFLCQIYAFRYVRIQMTRTHAGGETLVVYYYRVYIWLTGAALVSVPPHDGRFGSSQGEILQTGKAKTDTDYFNL